MPISEIKQTKDGYAVEIKRSNGTTYKVTSEDYQSMVDYRNEYLESQARRKTR